MSCTTGCPTKDCESYAACLRGKSARIAYCNSATGQDYTAQKRLDKDLAYYKSAREQGIQPSGTTRAQTMTALHLSDKAGEAYQA